MTKGYGSKKCRRGGWITVLDIVVFCLTVVCCAALLCAYLARFVSPEKAWIFSFAALAAPVLIVSNILFTLYWSARWKVWAFMPLATLVLGAGYFSMFFKPVFKQSYPQDPPKGMLTVVTHNVMGFLIPEEGGRFRWNSANAVAFFRETDPDIICIQEFQCYDAAKKAEIDSLIGLPYNRVNYRIASRNGGGWGVAIYSRYPIINAETLDFPNSTNSSIWSDIVVGKDTLRVFSNHLQTTSVDKTELDYINNHEFMENPVRRDEIVRGIASKLRRNFSIRATQADTLSRIIRSSPYKTIVCGDFNDTPMSYAYFRIRGELNDAFVEKGKGLASNTFQGLFNLLRIDYVLSSPEIEVVSYETTDTGQSDHKAVTVGLLPPSRRR